MKILAAAVILAALSASPAYAQCVGGRCVAPRVRAVVAAPVRLVGRVVRGVRCRRAVRVNRRVGRRMARRARWGRCCG